MAVLLPVFIQTPHAKVGSNVPVSSQAISPEIEDHVAAVYDRTIYVGKVLEVNDSDGYITFY